MTGFELRLWRRGLNWDQDRAAEKMGISTRTYKRFEKSKKVSELVALATFALSTKYDN